MLPRGWRTTSLASVAGITLGQSPPGSSYNETGEGVPFFQGKTEFGALYAEVRKYTRSATKYASQGDILVSVRAPVGPTNLAPVDCAIGRGLAAVRAGDGVDQRYLLWALRAAEQDLAEHGAGSTFPAITGRQLRAHQVRIAPTMAEQRRIVDIVEDHITRLEVGTDGLVRAQRQLAAMWQSTLHAKVVGPRRTLGELAVESGYGTSTKCDRAGVGLPVARIPNIRRGHVDMTDVKYAVDGELDLTPLRLRRGDVLIVRTNGSIELIGRSAVVMEDIEAAFASYLIRYRVDEGKVLPRWVHLALESPHIRSEIEAMAASSAGQHNVGLAKLNRLLIPCPPVSEQKSAIEDLSSLEDTHRRLRAEVVGLQARSNTLRRALLAAAFSGKLTGGTTDDDVVEGLLRADSLVLRDSRQADVAAYGGGG
jgi:type I restriction enzyme S subunit